jgi:D-glycero-D-manno-heptose 1,7-bisphosphate phosphatase
VSFEAVFFDRDGTLIEDVPYNGEADKAVAMQGAVATVAAIRKRRLKTAVVTNQSGIGRGLLSSCEVERVNRRVDELVGPFDVWAVCPHAPHDGCGCRKPAPGLVFEAASRLGVRPIDVIVVGDRLADIGAANAAGALAVLVPSERTESDAARRADIVLSTIEDLVDFVDGLRGARL